MSITSSPYFTPKSITGCQLWLDAQDNSVISLTSGYVSAVTDKALGTSFTSVGSTPANLTVASASINSFQSFYFNNASANSVGLRGNLAQLTTGTAIFVMKYLSGQNGPWRPIFGWNDTTSVQSISFGTNLNGTGVAGPYVQNIGYNGSATATLTNNGLYIVVFTFNGTTTGVGYNGQLSLTAGTVSSYSGSSTSIGICTEANGTQMTNVYLGEIIIYNTVLGLSDRQNVETYLAQKWGLTSSLPSGHIGLMTKLYASSTQSIQVTPYTSVSYAFAPTQISNCQLWMDAADSSTLTFSGNNLITWKDKSGNNYSFSGSGAIWSNVGPSRNSNLYFNGSSSTSYLGTCALSQPYTIFVSAYQTTNTGSYQRILNGNCAAEQSGDQDLLFVGCLGTSLAVFNGLGVNTWNDTNANSPATNTLNTWMVTTATISGTNLTTYAYGSQLDSKNGAYTPSNVIALRISGGYYGGAVQQPWNGYIGEVIIYSGVLSSQQRQQIEGYLAQKWSSASSLSNASLGKSVTYFLDQSMVTRGAITTLAPATKIPINLTGLIIYYSFDNAIFDLYNRASLNLTGSFSYVTGRRGQAISITNTAGVAPTNYLSSSYVLPSVFTISLWFQTPNVSNGSMVFCANSNVSLANGSISIYFTGGNLFCAYSDVVNNATAFAISANTWYHTVLTYNSGSTTLYVNGSQSGNTITGTNSKNGFTFGGGRDTLTQYPFSGYIDEFRIYSRILTSTEITAIYNNLG